MSTRLLAAAVVALLGTAGCSRRDEPPPAGGGTVADAGAAPALKHTDAATAAVVSEADMSSVLAELTQRLRKFSFEQKRLPAAVSELVTAGYLSALPEAAPGKKFAIDEKKAQIILIGK